MEYVIAITEYLCIVMCVLVMIKFYNLNLKYYQQAHYHLTSFKKFFKAFYLSVSNLIIYPLIIAIFFMNYWYIQLLTSIYLGFILWYANRKKEIIKLKFTPRIIRQYAMIIIFDIVFGTLLMMWLPFKQLMGEMLTLIVLSPLIVLLSSLIIYPIEILISKGYHSIAHKKVNAINPLVIAVTGSFGKTSTKNIIYQGLSKIKRTTKSPNSYNSLNGVSLTINRCLDKNDEALVLEMGASHPRDLEKILKIVRPNISVVTEIGASHLETFKSMKNIITEKMRIVDALDENGIAFLNIDNKHIQKYQINTKAKIITFGFGVSTYQISDVKVYFDGIIFKIKYENQKFDVKSNLVGAHNAMNLTASFAVLHQLGMNPQMILETFLDLEKTPNRLEEKVINGKVVLDDSYNSNFQGFNNALEILKLYKNKKIIITPGIVETGPDQENINKMIAKKIFAVCDEAYIIASPTGKIIYDELKKLGFKKLHLFSNFKEAFNALPEEATTLIENDLPDYYFI